VEKECHRIPPARWEVEEGHCRQLEATHGGKAQAWGTFMRWARGRWWGCEGAKVGAEVAAAVFEAWGVPSGEEGNEKERRCGPRV
jgi:hypothetical protein